MHQLKQVQLTTKIKIQEGKKFRFRQICECEKWLEVGRLKWQDVGEAKVSGTLGLPTVLVRQTRCLLPDRESDRKLDTQSCSRKLFNSQGTKPHAFLS